MGKALAVHQDPRRAPRGTHGGRAGPPHPCRLVRPRVPPGADRTDLGRVGRILDLVLLPPVDVAKLSGPGGADFPSDARILSTSPGSCSAWCRSPPVRLRRRLSPGDPLHVEPLDRGPKRARRGGVQRARSRQVVVSAALRALASAPGSTAGNPCRAAFRRRCQRWAQVAARELPDERICPRHALRHAGRLHGAPAGYTQGGWLTSWSATGESRRHQRDPGPAPLEDPNIVVVLSESFSDPRGSRVVLPTTRSRIRSGSWTRHASGELLVVRVRRWHRERGVSGADRHDAGTSRRRWDPSNFFNEERPSRHWCGGSVDEATRPSPSIRSRRDVPASRGVPAAGSPHSSRSRTSRPANDRRQAGTSATRRPTTRCSDGSAVRRPVFAQLVTMRTTCRTTEVRPTSLSVEGLDARREKLGQYVRGLQRTDGPWPSSSTISRTPRAHGRGRSTEITCLGLPRRGRELNGAEDVGHTVLHLEEL